jgi:hypothetical protein
VIEREISAKDDCIPWLANQLQDAVSKQLTKFEAARYVTYNGMITTGLK